MLPSALVLAQVSDTRSEKVWDLELGSVLGSESELLSGLASGSVSDLVLARELERESAGSVQALARVSGTALETVSGTGSVRAL